MNIRILWLAATLLISGSVFAKPSAAQEIRRLSLADAVAEARGNHPHVAIAGAAAVGARQQARIAGAGRWPTLGAEAGLMASSDPVAAFGARLRQGRFTEADFDPARLNDPEAITDLDAAVALGWTPFDFSRDAALTAARAGADAADLGAVWARRVAGYQAEIRYLEAAAAELLLESAEASLEAAEVNLDQVERHAAEGMLTEADVLQARAALEDARLRGITAGQGVDDARSRLALALGWPSHVVPVPDTDALALSDAAPEAPMDSGRADLEASEARVRQASAHVKQADLSRMPKLQAFARLEAHADGGFSEQGDSWTVGVRMSVPLFTGFEIGARRAAARAELDIARLEHDRMLDEAHAALAEARRAAESRRSGAAAAEAAAEAALEAARLMRLRHGEGLVTTAELLAVESAATRHAATAVQARLHHRIAAASLLLLDAPALNAFSREGVDR